MKVKEFTMFSDHKPLELSLNLAVNNVKEVKPIHSTFSKAPPRYKITPCSKDDFLDSMKIQTEKAQNILQSSYADSSDGTYTLNSDITKYLQDIANASLTRTQTRQNTYTNNQPWFEKTNRVSKQNLRKAACTVSQFPESEYLRKNFYKVKHHYKTP